MKKLSLLLCICAMALASFAQLPDGSYAPAFTGYEIDKENGNYGSCINRGLKEARGKYIKVLDADDRFDTKEFGTYLEFLATTDVDLALTDFDYVSEDGSVLKTHKYNIPAGKWSISELGDKIYDMWMHAVTYRTAIFEGLNYHQTEGISYTDQEWIFLPMSKVKSLCGYPHVVYKYLVGREGQTVEPKVFARNILQEIRSWETQQEEWEVSKESGRGDAEAYMWYRLKSRAISLETNMILYFYSGYKECMLVEFDEYVRMHNGELYKEMENITRREGLRFRYIHYWRKLQCRPLVWLVFKVESVVKRRLFKI